MLVKGKVVRSQGSRGYLTCTKKARGSPREKKDPLSGKSSSGAHRSREGRRMREDD